MLALLADAPNTRASTVGFDALSQAVTYAAAPGEANALAVVDSAGSLTFSDTGTTASGGVEVVDSDGADGCSVDPVTPSIATCPDATVSSIVVTLDDSDDTFAADGGLTLPLSLGGGAGADTLSGGAGDDTLEGGTGNDTLDGAAGVDTFSYAGATGPVTVDLGMAGFQDTVGAGADGLSGGENLLGSDNNDTLTGDGGANLLSGAGGHDVLAGGAGPDRMTGGPGDDAASYSARIDGVMVSLDGVANDGAPGEGDDVDSDIANLTGGSGPDVLVGDARENRLAGGSGDDALDGGDSADALAGGPGGDTVSYAGRPAGVTVDLSTGSGGELGENDAVSEVEAAVGGTGNDRLDGSEGADALDGGSGNDVLDGRGGNDLVTGGADNDIIYGGEGDDRMAGSSGGDLVRAGNGRDSLDGGTHDDVLDGGGGGDVVAGGGGDDIVDYSARTGRVRVSFDGQANDGELNEGDRVGADVHSVRTGSGRDVINAMDGVRGSVACGSGEDAVRADEGDRVARDCEQLNGLSVSGRCRIARRVARLGRTGIVSLRVACAQANRGSVALTARMSSAPGKRKRTLKLGRRSFFLGPRAAATVKVRVSGAARRALRRAGRRVHARVTVTTRHRTGFPSTRRSGTVALKVR